MTITKGDVFTKTGFKGTMEILKFTEESDIIFLFKGLRSFEEKLTDNELDLLIESGKMTRVIEG